MWVFPMGYSLFVYQDEAERLDKAMEDAEDEMESAFRRAGDIHRVQIKRQEHEAFELRRLLAAKDRAIDNMRDTISSTKRALDAKLAQNEAAMAQRDSEVRLYLTHFLCFNCYLCVM